MADPAAFLARWSRLKQAARRPQPPEAAPPAESEEALPVEVPPEDLPPIESLTAESDFTPFMSAGVPDSLRNAALRKLWRSDPVLANLDGLVEYGEDYAAEYSASAVVNTAYRVLQGMPEEKPQAPPEPPQPAEPNAANADPSARDAAAGPIAAPDGRADGDRID